MIGQELLQSFLNDESGIEGWFYPAEILSLAAIDSIQVAMGMRGSICEVGVYKGKSLVFLSHLIRAELGERLFGFDLFPGRLREEAEENCRLHGAPCELQLIASDTALLTGELLTPLLTGGVRLLHIDAGHEYHEVFHQAVLFAPFVQRNGVIVFDDYQDREFPGIEAAVLDFCEIDRPRRFVPFFSGANKMYCCEATFASTYQQQLLQIEAVAGQCRLSRVRDFELLIGWSKLPVDPKVLLARIGETAAPLIYALDQQRLANQAAASDQLKRSGILIGPLAPGDG